MARSTTEIKKQMTDSFIQNETVISKYGLTEGKTFDQEFSKVSLEFILFSVFAFVIFVLESLFDTKEAEIDDKLLNQKSGRLPWYRFMTLQFQYGFDLFTDSDLFDNGTSTAAAIEDSKIIKYAAVNEGDLPGVVVIKVATETDNELMPITEDQELSFKAYVNEFKYAGTRVSIVNFLADRLFLTMQIEIDPLVINSEGLSILNGNKPVEDALNEFMKELPFDGELILQSLVDKLQLVNGVKIATLLDASTSWLDPILNDYGTPQSINVKKIPESGYFKIQNFDTITYVV
jgi:hypothetical protein